MTNESSADAARPPAQTAPANSGMSATDLRLPIGASQMGDMVQEFDWSATPIGPLADWPPHLRSAAGLVLDSGFPMFIWWGRHELTNIYNDAFISILGGLHPAALGKAAPAVWESVWTQVGPLVSEVFDHGRAVLMTDMQFYLYRNGQDQAEETYFTFSYSPIRDQAGGAVDGLLCVVTETTDSVLDRQKLTTVNQAKDEFISLASHQLRTPATGVKQFLGMLIGGYGGELTPNQQQFAQFAYDSNERQLSIITDLLHVAQADAGKIGLHKKPADLVQLINDVLSEQAAKFEERQQQVGFQHGKAAYRTNFDEERMRMVIDNLVDNASKYTPDGKAIQLALRQSKRGVIALSISDEGVGIAEEDQDSIFEKFIRADNPLSESAGGSGLGLYLAKKIVELHGGDISVSSAPGKGSTFTVTLPVT